MTTYRKEGKDVIIFATAEDHKKPSTVVLPEAEPQPGLILPNGEINWNCPCLGGMATGPCGIEFREAFSCFHNSEADPKGSDCYNAFNEMHLCMAEYPQLYSKYDEYDEEEDKALDINLEKTDLALSVDSKSNQSQDKLSTKILSEEKSVEKKSTLHSEPKVSKSVAVDEVKMEFQNKGSKDKIKA